MAALSVPSRWPTRGRKWDATLKFSGVPKQGVTIGSGCPSPVFSGAHRWVEVLRNPSVPAPPQTMGQSQKWLHEPYLLMGPQVLGSATPPVHSGGSGSKGRKSEVAAQPLPSERPTRGQTLDTAPAVLGVREQWNNIRSGHLSPACWGGPQMSRSAKFSKCSVNTVFCMHVACFLHNPHTPPENHNRKENQMYSLTKEYNHTVSTKFKCA